MLRELPFQTIGDIGRHGLELHVYCLSYASRIVATAFPFGENLAKAKRWQWATRGNIPRGFVGKNLVPI